VSGFFGLIGVCGDIGGEGWIFGGVVDF